MRNIYRFVIIDFTMIMTLKLTEENNLFIGSQQDRAMMPANFFGNVRAEWIANAPPCENPPTIMRSDEIPSLISFSIR